MAFLSQDAVLAWIVIGSLIIIFTTGLHKKIRQLFYKTIDKLTTKEIDPKRQKEFTESLRSIRERQQEAADKIAKEAEERRKEEEKSKLLRKATQAGSINTTTSTRSAYNPLSGSSSSSRYRPSGFCKPKGGG
jgi:DNA gyrase/topoisomerase IV subunit B